MPSARTLCGGVAKRCAAEVGADCPRVGRRRGRAADPGPFAGVADDDRRALGWDRAIRVLSERVGELRPVDLPPDPDARTTYLAGEDLSAYLAGEDLTAGSASSDRVGQEAAHLRVKDMAYDLAPLRVCAARRTPGALATARCRAVRQMLRWSGDPGACHVADLFSGFIVVPERLRVPSGWRVPLSARDADGGDDPAYRLLDSAAES